MDINDFHQWLIQALGPLNGETAWTQFQRLPDEIREQLLAQSDGKLPDPEDMRMLMQSIEQTGTAGLAHAGFAPAGHTDDQADAQTPTSDGPINAALATSLASKKAAEGSQSSLTQEEDEDARGALSTANLWLDTAIAFDPAPGRPDVLTREGWTKATIGAWIKLAAPVAKSTNAALADVFTERLGGALSEGMTGIFAGPVPIPLPDDMKDPKTIMRILGSTSFAIQLGQASGKLAHEVFGSFDQGFAMSSNPAGSLVPENIREFATQTDIPQEEAREFFALREEAHARLFDSAKWLMPQIMALVDKYARSISIDLDAVEEQLRDIEDIDADGISEAVNVSSVAMKESSEQTEAKDKLERMLALIEGWVDCVVWRAGAPFLPHIAQLREMMQRRRASGGPAEQTFEHLLGLQLRPVHAREARAMWDKLTEAGISERDAHWAHPNLLPDFEEHQAAADARAAATKSSDGSSAASTASASADGSEKSDAETNPTRTPIDWDSELERLLAEEGGEAGSGGDGDASGDDDADGSSNDSDSDTQEPRQ